MTAGTPAPQDAEMVLAVGRAAQEAIDAIPYERADYSDEHTWRIAGEAALAALAPVRAREVEAARRDGAREALEQAARMQTPVGVVFESTDDVRGWLRHLAATHAAAEQHDTKEDDRG